MAVGVVCVVCWGGGDVVVSAGRRRQGGKREGERKLEKQRELKFLWRRGKLWKNVRVGGARSGRAGL